MPRRFLFSVGASESVSSERGNRNGSNLAARTEHRRAGEVGASDPIQALINLAHVVGLVLFQSVRYDGIFSRFFARLSLFGTPIAIAVAVGLLL
jgi:hypothetical protein